MEGIITISHGYHIFMSETKNKDTLFSRDYYEACKSILLSLNGSLKKSENCEPFINAVDIINKRLMYFLGYCAENKVPREEIIKDNRILL